MKTKVLIRLGLFLTIIYSPLIIFAQWENGLPEHINNYLDKSDLLQNEMKGIINETDNKLYEAQIKNDHESVKNILIEADSKFANAIERLKALNAPSEMEGYHRKIIEYCEYIRKINEAVLHEDMEAKLKYNRLSQNAILEIYQELRKTNLENNAPKEAIVAIDRIIDQIKLRNTGILYKK